MSLLWDNRQIDRDDYEWQMEQLRPTDDEPERCPTCGSPDIEDGECVHCLTKAWAY